jgi:ectoine hydroxylase-related dioxygenase (phytanoyl-CoA dioxygenase family)
MVADLSLEHHPLTDLFPRVATTEDEEKYRLTDEQVEFFHENGYLKGVKILEEREVEVLREELARLVEPTPEEKALFYEFHSNESANPNTVLFHALGAWRVGRALHDILWNPRFTVPASQLLGGPVRFWHDQLFCKPAGHGGVVAWHQDFSYWTRTKPMQHLTCWIGLDVATTENGCMVYVPKSHTWPLLPVTGLAGNMHAIQTVLTDEQKAQFKEITVELPLGYAAFHHPLLVHGSYENRSTRSRRAVVLNVVRDGVKSDTDDALLAGVPPVPKGEPLGGQFFPLLYTPKSKGAAA